MSRPGPRHTHADYVPGEPMLDAIKEWEDSVKEEERLRNAARKAVADELRTSGVSQAVVAGHTPWTEPTLAGIAKEYGVPGLRQKKSD